MQLVIAMPAITEMRKLEAPFCGVPLLRRILATAQRSGTSRVLLVFPSGWSLAWIKRMLFWPVIESLVIDAVEASSAEMSIAVIDFSGFDLPVIAANEDEAAAHDRVLADLDKASGGKTVWRLLVA